MITYIEKSIFQSPAQVLTNTVNCVGVMGKGLALEFKNRHPEMFDDYKLRCDRGEVRPGIPYLWEDDQVQILNFPTKRHWRENSLIEDIDAGLKYLAEHYQEMGICSLALPQLGCGNGGLSWGDVQPLIEKYLAEIPDLEVFVYVASIAKSQSDDTKSGLTSDPANHEGLAAQASLPL
jgi:O-acetyl-ADP-ribose deacetylase (regulator of RNase III)